MVGSRSADGAGPFCLSNAECSDALAATKNQTHQVFVWCFGHVPTPLARNHSACACSSTWPDDNLNAAGLSVLLGFPVASYLSSLSLNV